MAPEFLRHGAAGRVRTVCVVGGDFRELVPIGTPTALERKVIQRKNHDAAAKVVVGDVDLIRRFVDSNFFDSSHDHGRGCWILLSESRLLSCCLRCPRRGVGRIAAAAAATATTCGGHGDESRNWAGGALARNADGKRWSDERLALWSVGHVRNLTDNFAGLRVVLADGVLSDVDEPLAVNIH